MKLSKCFKHAFSMVVHSKLRSWLTIIGIVIGVAAVIAIVSLGEGMQQSFNERFGQLGGDLLTITPGFSRGSGFGHRSFGGSTAVATEEEVVLDRTDLQALKGIPDLILIDTRISGRVDSSYLGKTGSISLTGVDQKVWADITTSEAREGRLLDSADQNVVVIGGRLADSFFEQPLGINKMFNIENTAFRVVGILDDTSTNVYMPLQMAYQVIDDKETDVYDSIIVKVKDEDLIDETINKTEKKLKMVRHVSERDKDFTVSSSKATQEARAEILASMNLFLLAIAAVSLIVGAVGIANTMFTSVLEKTKEIGIMKAIGARNNDIMIIFLLNSILIGLVGGVIGVFFGTLLSGAIPALMGGIGFFRGGAIVSTNAIIMAMTVSILVGVLAGVIPAYKASKLKPVDALRYD